MSHFARNDDGEKFGLASAIGIALIILPLLSPILLILILLNPVINEDANFIPPEAAPLLPLRPESPDPALVRRQIGAFDVVDAIRNGWHDRVQAIADGARFAVLENLCGEAFASTPKSQAFGRKALIRLSSVVR